MTTLDPQTALIVIDLQRGIVGRDLGPYPSSQVVEKTAETGSTADLLALLVAQS